MVLQNKPVGVDMRSSFYTHLRIYVIRGHDLVLFGFVFIIVLELL